MKLTLLNAKGAPVAEYRSYTNEGFYDILMLACGSGGDLAERQCAADPDERELSHRAMLTLEPGRVDGRYFDGAHIVYDAKRVQRLFGPSFITTGKPQTFSESDFAGALEYLMGC